MSDTPQDPQEPKSDPAIKAEFDRLMKDLADAARKYMEHEEGVIEGAAMALSERSGRPFNQTSVSIVELVRNDYIGENTQSPLLPVAEIEALVFRFCHDWACDLVTRHTFPEQMKPGLRCPACEGEPDDAMDEDCLVYCLDKLVNNWEDLAEARRQLEVFHDMEDHPGRDAVWEMTMRMTGFHLLVGHDILDSNVPTLDGHGVADRNSDIIRPVIDVYRMVMWTLVSIQLIRKREASENPR